MTKIESIQNEIVENFGLLDEWEDKYEYLLDLGKQNEVGVDELRIEGNLVKGCQSKVWVKEILKDGSVYYSSDGDAPVPQSLAAVLVKILSGNTPESIVRTAITFHKETDLILYLSPARAKGLESMIMRFKELANKYINKGANV